MKKVKLIAAVVYLVVNVLLAVFLYGIIIQNTTIIFIGIMVMVVIAGIITYNVTKNYIKNN